MLVGKARSLSKSVTPERYFTQVGSGLHCKHFTRLKRLASDKRSSLLWKVTTYDRKTFYNIGHRFKNRVACSCKKAKLGFLAFSKYKLVSVYDWSFFGKGKKEGRG
jgi:hypothetical protein